MPLAGRTLLPITLVCLLLVAGCVPALKTNTEELNRRARGLKAVKMVSPEIKIYELSAGDVSELRDDWSASGKRNAEKAIAAV